MIDIHERELEKEGELQRERERVGEEERRRWDMN